MSETEDSKEQVGASHGPSAEWLQRETAAWVSEGLIRAEQAEMLLARYGMAGGESTRTLRWRQMAAILGALGALLIGSGIILVMASNWEEIPRVLRLAILIIATLASYCAGYYLAYEKRTYPAVGKALVLLGSLLFGASIFLIGQMYHISGEGGAAEYSAGFFWWFAGTLPLAYVLSSPLQLVVALAAGTMWVHSTWIDRFWVLPTELYCSWALGFGCLLASIGLMHRLAGSARPGLASLQKCYTALGMVFVLGALYGLSFRLEWKLPSYASGMPALSTLAGSASLLAPTIAAVLVSAWNLWRGATERQEERERTVQAEAGTTILLALLAAGVFWLFVSHSSKGLFESGITLARISGNVLLLAVEIAVIALGWRRLESGLVNLGLLAFFVHLMTRYFDVFGTLLKGGLAFIGAGIVLVGGGWLLESARRRLLQTMTPPAPGEREAAP